MTAVAGLEAICAVQVVIGVDTHQDEHVAVAIDQQGVRLAERHAPASSYWYRELVLQRQFKQNRARAYSASYGTFLRSGSRPSVASLKIRTSAAFRYQLTL